MSLSMLRPLKNDSVVSQGRIEPMTKELLLGTKMPLGLGHDANGHPVPLAVVATTHQTPTGPSAIPGSIA